VEAFKNLQSRLVAENQIRLDTFPQCCMRGSIEMIRLLIDAGSDIQAVDLEKRGAYDLASEWGKREVAGFLKSLFGR